MYENEDILPITEQMYEDIFCCDAECTVPADSDGIDLDSDIESCTGDTLGDAVFARISHRTDSRITKPSERYGNMF